MPALITLEEANTLKLKPLGPVKATDDSNYMILDYKEQQAEVALKTLQRNAEEKGATHLVAFSPSYEPGPGKQVGTTTVRGLAYKAA